MEVELEKLSKEDLIKQVLQLKNKVDKLEKEVNQFNFKSVFPLGCFGLILLLFFSFYLNTLNIFDSSTTKYILEYDDQVLCVADENPMITTHIKNEDEEGSVSVIVFGASGDLATKKTFPSLFSLYCHKLLPENSIIIGFARSKLSLEDFRKHVSKHFPGNLEKEKQEFLDRCFYRHGSYDSTQSYISLNQTLNDLEKERFGAIGNRVIFIQFCFLSYLNLVFYLAIPPSIFLNTAEGISNCTMSKGGWNRVIIEKPFGHDLESSCKLSTALSLLFTEDQMFRIDHYLGKEMVQNLMALRFANVAFEPLWNRSWIKSVSINFKEDIGTGGRGGYFDGIGIIRDVMQNHLLQILSLVAMEPPVSLSPENVRDEKVKVLRSVLPISIENVVLGQYVADKEGKNPGYKDDATVPDDSTTPTFASFVMYINNSRWQGVPFIMKAGKGLNERKSEIRLQFTQSPNGLYSQSPINELVIRVQPNEAIYWKLNTKAPGLNNEDDLTISELDLSYNTRFGVDIPDAYTRLIYDVLRGHHENFVRDDELKTAWQIFTPVLEKIENDKIEPTVYEFGTRGPKEADEMAKNVGFQRVVSKRASVPGAVGGGVSSPPGVASRAGGARTSAPRSRPSRSASAGGGTAQTQGGGSPGLGGGANSLFRFYAEDSPGLKISPTVGLVISLLFIFFVVLLHIWGKFQR